MIGVVGGMGPFAGLNLVESIHDQTKAKTDQDHLSIALLSIPSQIVDRTEFILGGSSINPAFGIADVIEKLYNMGADIISLACVTSYSDAIYNVLLEELQIRQIEVKMVNMLDETCLYLKDHFLHLNKVGILSTTGTYRAGVYSKLLSKIGSKVVVPEFEFQENVIHNCIYNAQYGIKSTGSKISQEALKLFNQAIEYFKDEGVDKVLLGCTEFSYLVSKFEMENELFIDPVKIVARRLVVEESKHKSKCKYGRNCKTNFLISR